MTLPSDDKIETKDGVLGVHAIHHASLILSWNGKYIFVDPAPLEEKANAVTEFKLLPKADLILYTHDHYDHYNSGILEAIMAPGTEIIAPKVVQDAMPASLRDKVHVMANGDKTTALGISVEATASYNTTPSRSVFHPKGRGNGYVLTLGGKHIYIAGDTEEAPELAHLTDIEAAFVPVNVPYTMSVPAAAHWIKEFKPRVVYPYHARNADGSLSDMKLLKSEVGSASEVRVLKWY